jgi:hypothetical protein
MAGADLRVTYAGPGSSGGPFGHDRGAVDASSEYGGDYTNKITVHGETVYVTDEGLKLLEEQAFFGADGLEGRIFSFGVQSDPGWIRRFFCGDSWKEASSTIGELP